MNTDVLVSEISTAERQFTVELVHTTRQLREVFRLRHQVYCIERGFEPGDEGEETDEFDSRSRHVLLRHASDGEVVGTVRIIEPDPAKPRGSLPMHFLCDPSLLADLPVDTIGEVSRFAISKQRRMSVGSATLLRLALVRGLVELSSEMGLTHWLAVMERTLLRLNQRNEIYFDPIGPLVSYHGVRQPAAANLRQMLETVRREQTPTWNFLTDRGRWFGPQGKSVHHTPAYPQYSGGGLALLEPSAQ